MSEQFLGALGSVRLWAEANGHAVTYELHDPYAGPIAEGFPDELKDVYSSVSDGLSLSWSDRGGNERYGRFELMPYEAVMRAKAEVDEIRDWLAEGGDPSAYFSGCGEEIGRRIIAEYANWWPFASEGDGDFLCLSSVDGKVYWYEHDRFDGIDNPEQHVVLADSLMDFIASWSQLKFVQPKSYWWGSWRRAGRVEWTADLFGPFE